MVLRKSDLNSDPLLQFSKWFEIAKNNPSINNFNAMCLSTVNNKGYPNSRMVLLKSIDDGFIFYTNLNSNKSKHIKRNPKVSLTLHWDQLGKQIRVLGDAHQIEDNIADTYFQSRPRDSQLSAWASKQSKILSSRNELEKRYERFATKFENKEVQRPSFWSGFRVIPFKFEFWQHGKSRLHDRFEYIRKNNGWKINRLYP